MFSAFFSVQATDRRLSNAHTRTYGSFPSERPVYRLLFTVSLELVFDRQTTTYAFDYIDAKAVQIGNAGYLAGVFGADARLEL